MTTKLSTNDKLEISIEISDKENDVSNDEDIYGDIDGESDIVSEEDEGSYLENEEAAGQTIDDMEDDEHQQIIKPKRNSKEYESEESFDDYESFSEKIRTGSYLETYWHFKTLTRSKTYEKYWYDCKYKKVIKFISNLFPILTGGTTDRQKQFHPFGIAIAKNEQEEDFRFFFRSSS